MIIRIALKDDAQALCSILNKVIEVGGTTALEDTFTTSEFESLFINGEQCICCLVAEDETGPLGFQALAHYPELPDDWADIATFVRINSKVKGVGTELLRNTVERAKAKGIRTINATIRADNKPGTRFYSKMGFEDYSIRKNVPLKDGTLVDRVSKKLSVR